MSQSDVGGFIAPPDFLDPPVDLGDAVDFPAAFEVQVPCSDTFHVWVRGFDEGTDDSFFAEVDGAPIPQEIFDLDCSGQGQGYIWAELNQRLGQCGLDDPWVQDWTAGVHDVVFYPRESISISRIQITNDPNYVP